MERIRELRNLKNVSQARLAVTAGMDPATLNRIEQGKGNPNLKTLEKLANALEVSVADLLSDSPKVEAPPSPELPFNDVLEEERRVAYLRALREFVTQLAERWVRKSESDDPDWNADPAETALDLLDVLLRGKVLGNVVERRNTFTSDEYSELLQLGAAVQTLNNVAENIPATEEQAQEVNRRVRLIQDAA